MNSISKPPYRVLILDADFVAALTILRSLSRQGIYCDIASAISKPLCQSSRHAKSFFKYPDPLVKTDDFVNFIANLLQENQYDLVIPVTERSLIPLSESNKLDPWRNQLAIAEKNSLAQVLDKSKTLELAKTLDISIPFSHPVSTMQEVESLADNLDYPVVLKPVQSIPNASQRKQLSVCYAHNPKELLHRSKELLPFCQLLIQQYAQGIGTGIELLANQGEIVYAFQHQRIHELPLSGGGSCLRKSITVDPVLLQASEKLISALNWHGVAMVEFKWQPETKQYWLMEINGRFWGSLPLADAAGADFPKMLFDLLVLNQLPETRLYKENIYCRKLSADLYWLEQVLRQSDDPRLFSYPDKKKILSDLLLGLHPTKHFFDVQSFNDPIPGLLDLFNILKKNTLRISELMSAKALVKYHGSKFVQKRLIKKVKQSNTILFLCYGNINRSALAEAIAEQSGTKNTKVIFHSAGFHKHENRPADSNMVKVADSHGVNLKNSHSTALTTDIVNQSDLILAMEVIHLERLANEYPNAKQKGYLLGSFRAVNSNQQVEISDPYNKEIAVYEKIFERIKGAVSHLILQLE